MSASAVEIIDLIKRFPLRPHSESQGSGDLPSNLSSRSVGVSRFNFLNARPPKKTFTAVDGVSLTIHSGEIFGLLGPNGAGKSTTIRMLATLLEPTSGTALINGFDLVRQPNQVRRSLGALLAGERSIYWKLTGRENLEYFAALFQVPPRIARRRTAELIERMELTSRADELVEKYSTGMKQRVAIAKTLLANPPVLLLDEPTLGLDPQAARQLRDLIGQLKKEGHTILLTTHYMEEADLLSDRIAVIDQGRIIALDNPANLKRSIRQVNVIHLEVSGWDAKFAADLQRLPGVSNITVRSLDRDSLHSVSLHASDSRQVLPGIVNSISVNGTRLVNMRVQEPSLEDVFINLTGKALRD